MSSTAPYAAVLGAVLFGCALSNFTPNIIGFPWPDPGWPPLPEEMYQAQTVYAPVFYRPTERSRNAWPLIRQIPPDAPVAASGDLLVPLSARAALYEFLDPNLPLGEVDYLLINTRMVHVGAGHYWIAVTMSESVSFPPGQVPEVHHRRVVQAIERFLAGGDWTLVERRGDIHLLRRTKPSARRSRQP